MSRFFFPLNRFLASLAGIETLSPGAYWVSDGQSPRYTGILVVAEITLNNLRRPYTVREAYVQYLDGRVTDVLEGTVPWNPFDPLPDVLRVGPRVEAPCVTETADAAP